MFTNMFLLQYKVILLGTLPRYLYLDLYIHL